MPTGLPSYRIGTTSALRAPIARASCILKRRSWDTSLTMSGRPWPMNVRLKSSSTSTWNVRQSSSGMPLAAAALSMPLSAS